MLISSIIEIGLLHISAIRLILFALTSLHTGDLLNSKVSSTSNAYKWSTRELTGIYVLWSAGLLQHSQKVIGVAQLQLELPLIGVTNSQL